MATSLTSAVATRAAVDDLERVRDVGETGVEL